MGDERAKLEIEITREMLDAGAEALDRFLWLLDWQAQPIGKGNCKAAAEAVFRAMLTKSAE